MLHPTIHRPASRVIYGAPGFLAYILDAPAVEHFASDATEECEAGEPGTEFGNGHEVAVDLAETVDAGRTEEILRHRPKVAVARDQMQDPRTVTRAGDPDGSRRHELMIISARDH